MKILLDTNFLLGCLQRKVQVFEHLEQKFSEILIPRGVVDELVRIVQEGKPLERARAEVVLQLIGTHEVTILPLGGYVDEQILRYVSGNKGVFVGTLDRGLQRLLKGKARVLVLRSRKFEIV